MSLPPVFVATLARETVFLMAGMRLVRRPQKPRWRPFVSSIDEDECDESWIQFMNLKS